MSLTPEQQELGRRNFMRVLAGTPAVAALAGAAALKGPVRGGPVRVGFIATGGQGRTLLEQTDPQFAEIVAICDINPLQLAKADAVLNKGVGARELFEVIRGVAAGERLVEAPSAAALQEAHAHVAEADRAVLGMLLEGTAEADAARTLGRPVADVRHTVQRTLSALRHSAPLAG